MYHVEKLCLSSIVVILQLYGAASSSCPPSVQTLDGIAQIIDRHMSKKGSFVNKQLKRQFGWQPKTIVGVQDALLSPRLIDITTLTCSLDGRKVITGGTDGTVRIWTIAEDGFQTINKHDAPIIAISCTDTAASIFSLDKDGLISLWEAESKKSRIFSRGMYTALACSQEAGHLFVAPDHSTQRAVELCTKRLQPAPDEASAVTAIACSGAGTELFIGTSAGLSYMWDLPKQRLYNVDRKRQGAVSVLACARDGSVCVSATGGRNFQVCILDAKAKNNDSNKSLFKVALSGNHDAAVLALACTNDGKRIFSGTAFGTIYESTLLMRRRISMPMVVATIFDRAYHLVSDGSQAVHALACNGDGSRVFSVSKRDFVTWSDYKDDVAHLSAHDFALLLQLTELVHTPSTDGKIDLSDERWRAIVHHLPQLQVQRFTERLLSRTPDDQELMKEKSR